jgi:C-methyltransferase C-terminal domain/Methyltransferase domain
MASPEVPVVEHDLALAFCWSCGVVQLSRPFPYQDLVPPYAWMTYREPEDHLDAVVERVCALPGLNKDSTIAGITFKDATTLERMRKRGYSKIWSLDPREDLGATHRNANIESIQALLTPAKAAEIVARRGPVDLLIVRHIVEHAESPWRLMSALSALVSPNGYIVLEVPDCTANLRRQDYSMVWEEHTIYFTPETFPQVLPAVGGVSRGQQIHPFPFEDVIVLYAQKSDTAAATGVPQQVIEHNGALARHYANAFGDWTARYRSALTKLTSDGRRLAAYGAGHLTCAFLNLHRLSDFFAFVVDDTPHKQGLFLPQSRLPIVSRDRLTADKISACLFGLTPQLEDRIIANNAQFSGGGGKFYSMFVDSRRSIRSLV